MRREVLRMEGVMLGGESAQATLNNLSLVLCAGEILGVRLLTLHNIHRYMAFMAELRQSLEDGSFAEFRRKAHAELNSEETP